MMQIEGNMIISTSSFESLFFSQKVNECFGMMNVKIFKLHEEEKIIKANYAMKSVNYNKNIGKNNIFFIKKTT